jgi:hypothetical protein
MHNIQNAREIVIVKWRLMILGIGFLALQIVRVPSAFAQQQNTNASSESIARDIAAAHRDSSADSVALMTALAIADTGRMTPPYRDLSRYDTPGFCLAAIDGAAHARWRKHENDTIQRNSAGDTVPMAAKAIGRQCAAHLPDIAHTPVLELPDRLRLSLLIDDTATFTTVVDRQMTSATSKPSLHVNPTAALCRVRLHSVDNIPWGRCSSAEMRRFIPSGSDWNPSHS